MKKIFKAIILSVVGCLVLTYSMYYYCYKSFNLKYFREDKFVFYNNDDITKEIVYNNGVLIQENKWLAQSDNG